MTEAPNFNYFEGPPPSDNEMDQMPPGVDLFNYWSITRGVINRIPKQELPIIAKKFEAIEQESSDFRTQVVETSLLILSLTGLTIDNEQLARQAHRVPPRVELNMSSSSEEIQAATVAAAIRSKLTTDVTTQTAIYKKLEKAYDLYAGYGASEREQLKKLTWQYRKDPEEGAALMQVSVLRRKGLIGVNAAHATQDVLSMLYGWQKEHSLPERELRVLETQEPVQ